MIDIMNIDWATVGTTAATYLGIAIGVIVWLKRNMEGISQMKKDGADLTTQAKYYKAMIKDNSTLRTDINNGKIQTMALNKTFTGLLKKKNEEILELKTDLKLAISVMREAAIEEDDDELSS